MPSICHQCEMNFTPITIEGMDRYQNYLAAQTDRALRAQNAIQAHPRGCAF